jgi:hypothetical protein
MQLCDNGHEEVCFEGRTCPLCEYRDDSTSDIRSLKADIEELKRENEVLHDQIVEFEKIISENNFKNI